MVMPLAGPMMPALASALFVSWRRVGTAGPPAMSVAVLTVLIGSSWLVTARDEVRLSAWIASIVHARSLTITSRSCGACPVPCAAAD